MEDIIEDVVNDLEIIDETSDGFNSFLGFNMDRLDDKVKETLELLQPVKPKL